MIDPTDDQHRAVRTGDKLTYRILLQNKVDMALNAMGTEFLGYRVLALKTACYFDQSGLLFKTLIDEKIAKLNKEYIAKVMVIVKNNRDEWLHPIKKHIHSITLNEWYFTSLLEFIIDMLASHNALLESKDYVEMGQPV